MNQSTKQNVKTYDGYSYLQYQYRMAEQRASLQKIELNNSMNSLCGSDMQFIEHCLGQGKNLIISYASCQMLNLQPLKTQLSKNKQKKVILLENLEHIYNFVMDTNVQIQSQQIIISLHGIPSLSFRPFLLKLLITIRELQKNKNTKFKYIISCSNVQMGDVQQIIKTVQAKYNSNTINAFSNIEIVQLSASMPHQYTITDNLLQNLQRFLNDQSKQANKRDVVIFNDPSDQFKKKLFYLTKTKGFNLLTKILYDREEDNDQGNSVSKIFVARNVEVLLKQGHDLSQVYLILDYEQNFYNFFSYEKNCYIQVRSRLSYKQKCQRVNLLLGRMGEYCCMNVYQQGNYMTLQEERKYIDYGHYCLSMVELGLRQFLDQESKSNSQIKFCLNTLKNNEIIDKNQRLFSKQILKYCEYGVNPILVKSIMKCLDEKQITKANLLILTYLIITSPNLRKQEKQTKPASIWHKTGYLQSCLDVIIKSLQFKADQQTLFEQIAADLQIQISTLMKILNDYDRLCKMFNCQKQKWENQLEEDVFNELLEQLITVFKPAVATFSGSRRLGYLLKGSAKGLLTHRESLMSYYNEKPNFVLLLKLVIDPQTQQLLILNCNYIRDDILVLTYGCLPTLSKQSYGQCEIQFLNIPSATFSHLAKFNGLQIQIFEKENNCSIEANSQLNTITIQCQKQKQKQIYDKFDNILKDIQQIFKRQSKTYRQSNYLHVVLSAGAQTTNFIEQEPGKAKQVLGMAVVKNLAPEVGLQELKQLFDEFIQLKDLKISQNQNPRSAIVSFYSAQHYDMFFQIFSGCNYYDYVMIVAPYIEEFKAYTEEEYLLFEWNVWKSVGQAFIQFQDVQTAKNSLTNIKNLAGPKAKITQNANMIFAQQLDPKVDQKQILKWVMGLGRVLNIQVRRYSPKNQLSQDVSVKQIIKNAFPQDNITCATDKIVKGKNGHRSCQVYLDNKNKLEQIYFVLNEAENIVGQGALYVTPMFTYPIKLPEPNETYVKVYLDIINDFSKQLGRIEPLQTQLIRQPLQYVLIIKSNSQDEMTIIKAQILQRLKGRILNIKIQDSSILFTELALKNFQKIQKQHPIKIIPNILQKNIKVLCKPSTFDMIQKQINTQIQQAFIYHIPTYQKAFFYLQKNYAEVLSEELKTNLKVKFQIINRNIVLEGNLFILEKARQKINKSLKKLKQQAEQNFDMETSCQLCCQQFKHPFKLQGCGHIFCFDCLQTSIKYQIQDINLYPLKCPQCRQKIWISDLDCLIQKKQWDQVLKMAVNHFVFVNPGFFMFCITAGCKFIVNHKYKSSYICKQCKKGYCLQCRNLIHIGMTCHEARYGSDRLFAQYMNTMGGRVCANKQCKAPIERISGCFKVQCSRCKKCMCFKCPASSMVAYNTPQETYNHLNKIHGGCF